MQLSELAALLSLATADEAKKVTLTDSVLRRAGFGETAQEGRRCFFRYLNQKTSFSLTEARNLLQAFDIQLPPRQGDGNEAVLRGIVEALANGSHRIASSTLSLFLCFLLTLPHNEKLSYVMEAITRREMGSVHGVTKIEILEAIPKLIAVAYAASVLVDSSWSPSSNNVNGLRFSTKRILLSCIVEVTFDASVPVGSLLSDSELFPFVESCAKNLSDLMLQQTLLEQQVFRVTSANNRDSMQLLIAQSKQLIQKYVKDPLELETVMNEIWRDSVSNYGGMQLTGRSTQELESSETTSVAEPSQLPTDGDLPIPSTHSKHPSIRSASRGMVMLDHEQLCAATTSGEGPEPNPTAKPQDIQQQNDLFQALYQTAGDLGQRFFLFSIGRFLLFLALLYGTGAFGYVLVKEAGLSIGLSLLITFTLTLILGISALYCAGRRCHQVGDEASRNICGLLQTNAPGAAVDELLKENGAPGLQPMVKTVVPAQRWDFSRRPGQLHGESEDEATPHRSPIAHTEIQPSQPQELTHGPGSASQEDSVASKLRGIVSTVGKIAAHFNNDSSQKSQLSARMPSQASASQSPERHTSGLEVHKQSAWEVLLNAYPHMKDPS